MVEFHVTSLDVIHSFWAYKLGVKADANPGVDNIAFVKPTKLESFNVRCAELCGIWHGYMSNAGRVVTPGGVHDVDPRTAEERSPRRRRSCRSTAPPTYPNQQGAENEHDEPKPQPPPSRPGARCGGACSASTC